MGSQRWVSALRVASLAALAAALVAPTPRAAHAASGVTVRVSVDDRGVQGDYTNGHASVSGNGRQIAFASESSNLVPGDTNGSGDVFVRDLKTRRTVRVNVSTSGEQARGGSGAAASLSHRGRFVAFDSLASNLAPGDTNGAANLYAGNDVFLRDRDADGDGVFDERGAVRTTRESLSTGGREGNGGSFGASVSADGRYVAFSSWASNLVPGDTNGVLDVFVRDRVARKTVRVSVSTAGRQARTDFALGDHGSSGGAISGDGRYMAYWSNATNLVPGDTNGSWDVFVRDRDADGDRIYDERGAVRTGRATVTSRGAQASPNHSAYRGLDISANGRYVAFDSEATDLVPRDTNGQQDVFVRDLRTGRTVRVSLSGAGAQGDGRSHAPSISADGRYVAFGSTATTIAPDQTQGLIASALLRDRDADGDGAFDERGAVTTTRVSVNNSGRRADGLVRNPSISGDGRSVAFDTSARNMPDEGGNMYGYDQVYVRHRVGR